MSSFCPDPLFDSDVSWNTPNPNLTQCMRDTVCVALPALVLFSTAIPHLLLTSRHHTRRSLSVLFCTKLLLNGILVSNAAWEAQHRATTAGDRWPSDLFQPVCLLLTYISALLLLLYEKYIGLHTSPPLFLYWLTLTFGAAPTFKVQVEGLLDSMDGDLIYLTATFFPVVLLLAVANCWSDLPSHEGQDLAPESLASFFSKLFFGWLDGILMRGYKEPLIQYKLPPSPGQVNVQANVKDILRHWTRRIKSKGKDFTSHDDGVFVGLWPPMMRAYAWQTLAITALGTVAYTVTFVQPQVLKYLIDFVENGDEETWKGYFYCVVLLLSTMAKSVAFHQFYQLISVNSLQMRTSAISLVYRKALRLSNKARKRFTAGEITNLMSVDAQRIVETFQYVHRVWGTLLTIILCLYFLYIELGVAAFAGAAVLVLFIPINTWCFRINQRLQQKQLKCKDARIKLMNEILAGIKVLKLYAWENPFMDRVHDIREKEIKNLKVAAKVWALTNLTFTCTPFLVTLVSFAVFSALNPSEILTANKIFVSISLFNIMRMPLILFPWSIIESVKLFVSIKRINKFLNAKELDTASIKGEVRDDTNAVELVNATLTWTDGDKEGHVKDVSLDIPKGSLTAVVGIVGSGKSSLISSILGDMELVKGEVRRAGKVAYVPQQAWIQNMSLRDNITFGKSMDRKKYTESLEACALLPDLKILKSGDRTEIGENGINLSGGQKQRVSLARAVYSEADIYLLDDPLSAVDADVGRHIFERVIGSEKGALRKKTRVLVTHSLHFLDRVDQIVVMKDGAVAERGTLQELKDSEGAFAEFHDTYANETKESAKDVDDRIDSFVTNEEQEDENKSKASKESKLETLELDTSKTKDGDEDERLVEDEDAAIGQVSLSVFLKYLKNVGPNISVLCAAMYVSGQAFHAAANFWLSLWADQNDLHPEEASESTARYLGVYALLGVAETLNEFIRELVLFLHCAGAARAMHAGMLVAVMRSPMSFFDTNPTGRILNRFSADVNTIDQTIPERITDFAWSIAECTGIFVVIAASTPMFITVMVPIFACYYLMQKFYIASSRQLKRLESISKSPIFSHFTETLNGAPSVRAYKQEERFIRESEGKVQDNVKCFYLSVSVSRWLAIRSETLGNFVSFFASIFAVLARDTISPGLAGLSISYSLNVALTLNWLVQMASDLETNGVALERVVEYSKNEPEAEWDRPEADTVVGEDWPTKGVVEFKDYQTRYRKGLDLVLKGIDLQVSGREKIGLCGRTGAGKSSLTLALFRIIEPAGGRITIDGADILTLGLHKLRSRLTIIPQDPVLFTGSLRFNVDPTGLHEDADIWRVLDLAHLRGHIDTLSDGLDHEVSEGGENFSVGQRQLICLARALLRKTRILVLDEATAAVDLETDGLIQETIRREFADCTVLTIAHRLNTIMDCDRVAVLGSGRVRELGAPEELMAREGSEFRAMASSAGLRSNEL